MNEIFDATDVPDDDAHWNALAARIAAGAIAANRTGRFAAPRALWIGVSLAFAASLVAMIASGQRPAPRDTATISIALVPADDVGRAIARADAPPTVGELVLGGAAGEAP
jgi:hypothetical protein